MATSIESPCIRNCCLNEANICAGCFRHLDEIICWGTASDATKKYILAQVAERRFNMLDQQTGNKPVPE